MVDFFDLKPTKDRIFAWCLTSVDRQVFLNLPRRVERQCRAEFWLDCRLPPQAKQDRAFSAATIRPRAGVGRSLGIHTEDHSLGAHPELPCVSLLAFLVVRCHSGGPMPSDQKTGTQNEEAIDVIVLCIDTEARDMIAYWLKSLPARTFVAKDGYQANKILRDVPCRLLITDRLLPPWPGLGRINRLLAR